MHGLPLRIVFIIFAFLAVAVIAPIAGNDTIAYLADYLCHLAAIVQAKLALTEGQFPLRVMPFEQDGWRYAFYQFSSPTTYTIAGLIYKWVTPHNPMAAFNIIIWSSITLGGFYMYRLAYWFVNSQPAAILAGVVYLYAPYYIVIINHLGNLNETAALGLVPIVIYFTIQRFYHPTSNIILAKLALAWYLLITVHAVTFVYTSLFVALLLIFISYKSRRHWLNLFRVGIAYIFACLLSMWFLAPLTTLQKYFSVSDTYNNPAQLQQYRSTLSQLLSPAANLTEGFKISALLSIHPSIGWPIVLAALICLYGLINKLSSGFRRADYWLSSLLIIFLIAFILVWSPINIWNYLPQPLLTAQYCWRLLSQMMWIGALLFAWAVCWLFKNKLDHRHAIVGTFLIVMSMNTWFPTLERAKFGIDKLIDKPGLIYNSNSYTIDFNRHPTYVSNIDNISFPDYKSIQLEKEYLLPPSLVNLAEKPAIEVIGTITNKNQNIELQAVVNDKVINSYQFKEGKIFWVIPLTHAKSDTSSNNPYKLIFKKVSKNDTAYKPIAIEKMLLSGFLQPTTILNAEQMTPLCHQQGAMTRCKVDIKSPVNLVELPILYYPDMLRVSINKKPVSYESILYQGKLITALKPPPGLNIIDVQFIGLEWANWVSICAWALWLVLLLCSQYTVFRIKRL